MCILYKRSSAPHCNQIYIKLNPPSQLTTKLLHTHTHTYTHTHNTQTQTHTHTLTHTHTHTHSLIPRLPLLRGHTNFMRMTFHLVSRGGAWYIWACERRDRWTSFYARATGWTPFDAGIFTKFCDLKVHTYTFKHCYRGRLQLYTARGSTLV